jgi:hypothetical protein
MLTVEEGVFDSDLETTPQVIYREETVAVQPGIAATGNQPYVIFRKPHNAGSLIKVFGNPGPWTRYDPRQDTDVVPYFSIID